jgi:hypothetical protein
MNLKIIAQAVQQVSFQTIDLKLTPEGQIKILEYGIGIESGFKGFKALQPQTNMYTLAMRDLVKKTHLPLWIIGSEEEHLNELNTKYGSHSLVEEGAVRLSTLTKYIKGLNTPNMNPGSNYKGILWGKPIKSKTSPDSSLFRNGPLLVLDKPDILSLTINNKYLTNSIIKKVAPHLSSRFVIKPLNYYPSLASEIIREIPTENYVIKPLRECMGTGIVVVHKDELDETLKNMRLPISNREESDIWESVVFGEAVDPIKYWQASMSDVFMIEEYHTSKQLLVKNQLFNGTMRIAFNLIQFNSQTDLSFLGEYWKLPVAATQSDESLSEKSISKIHSEATSSAAVSQDDKEQVYAELRKHLPDIFINMMDKQVYANNVSTLKEVARQFDGRRPHTRSVIENLSS